MNKLRIGVICPSEIAFRRFLPSLKKVVEFEYVGVAIANAQEWAGDNISEKGFSQVIENEREKARTFVDSYGGKIFDSYHQLIESTEVDAIYIPLPPALHYKWTKTALALGKHVLVEKPFTINLAHTKELVEIARSKKKAIHENYMFVYHKQLKEINSIISNGEIGKVRLYRISFGFPHRDFQDFRYNENLGGGALYDCGGYTIKYASYLLGESAKLVCAKSYYEAESNVDIFGSATLVNKEGVVAQVSFGMDNDYKCDLEVWGNAGTLLTKRILTASDGFVPEALIKNGKSEIMRILSSDETFVKSIKSFYECIMDEKKKEDNYNAVLRQACFVNEFEKIR